MIQSFRIIRSLLHTEKGTMLAPFNKYIFEVDVRVNKAEIKKAVEDIYKVKVKKVNTMTIPGKLRRVRFKPGRTPEWKKAIVTLREGHKIDIAT